jgi:hypothetical protein
VSAASGSLATASRRTMSMLSAGLHEPFSMPAWGRRDAPRKEDQHALAAL